MEALDTTCIGKGVADTCRVVCHRIRNQKLSTAVVCVHVHVERTRGSIAVGSRVIGNLIIRSLLLLWLGLLARTSVDVVVIILSHSRSRHGKYSCGCEYVSC